MPATNQIKTESNALFRKRKALLRRHILRHGVPKFVLRLPDADCLNLEVAVGMPRYRND